VADLTEGLLSVAGHGYWHIMTGYGAFLMSGASICKVIMLLIAFKLMYGTGLQLAAKVSPDAYRFEGESWFPVVRSVESNEPNGKGSMKGSDHTIDRSEKELRTE
jgi:hypothetical protein